MPQRTVMIVDDEPRIVSFLDDNLRSDDFEVVAAESLDQARSRIASCQPDVVLLDVMLPDGSGFELCREIRELDPMYSRIDPETPIIMLTARSEEMDRVRGFHRGADDYLSKPFHYPELLARIEAVLRRTSGRRSKAVVSVAGIKIDTALREVQVNGSRVSLSGKEFQLLLALARDPQRVFQKDELLESIWGYRSMGATRTVDSHASRLRKKLQPHAKGQQFIANVWGVGYRLVAVADPA